MFVIDDLTMILGISAVAVSTAVPFVNVLLKRLKSDDTDEVAEAMNSTTVPPGISIVVTVDDEAEDLKNNLPLWLDQDYKGEYQVVLVQCSSNEQTEDAINTFCNDNHLYTTFIPASSRYMSRRKLAITVGVKAAKFSWVMLTDVDCRPNSRQWLATMARSCKPGTDIVLGESFFEDDYTSSRRFDHAYTLYRQLAVAQRKAAWAYCGNNLLFRKGMFIEGKGFDGNLKYIRGEYDFIVNKFSTDTNTAVETNAYSRVTEDELTDKGWHNKNLFYMATRKHLQRSLAPRIMFNLAMWLMALVYILDIAMIVYSVVMQNWLLTVAASFALVLTVAFRMIILAKTLGCRLDEMSVIKMWWFELTMPIRNFMRILRYKMTDKYDYISHKI